MSTHHPSFGRNSGFGNVFKSFASSLKLSSSKSVPVQINPTVVGGGRDLRKLLILLQSGSLPQRASTAAQLTESLSKFSISSTPEVWYLARDMCDPKVQSYIRRTALELMNECIANDELSSTGSKLMYYKDVLTYCQLSEFKVDQEFDLFLKVLKTLTHDGRDIQELCLYDHGTPLPVLLNIALKVLGRSAKSYTSKLSDETLQSDGNYKNLTTLIQFTKNCIKFNATMIDDEILGEFIRRSIYIAQKTTEMNLATSCIELLTIVIIFANIEYDFLYDVVKYLCVIYGTNDTITELCWNAISVLASHGTFYAVGDCLKGIITDDELQSFRNTDPETALTVVLSNTTIGTNDHKESNACLNACVGAIQIIERLTISSSVELPLDSVMLFFLPSLIRMASFHVPTISTTLLRSLDRVFSSTSSRSSSNINTNKVMEQVYLFQLWYSSKSSIYDLFNAVKISSDIDISYWKSICLSLQKSYEGHELSTPKERLILLFTRNYQFLSNQTIKFILKYYTEEKLLTSLSPFARENSTKLLNYFYHSNQQANDFSSFESLPEIRLELLKSIKNAVDVSYSMERNDYNFEIVVDVLKRSVNETDDDVLAYFFNEIFLKTIDRADISVLLLCADILLPYFEVNNTSRLKSLVSLTSSGFNSQISNETSQVSGKLSCNFKLAIAKAFIGIFVAQSTRDAKKALEAYKICVTIAQHALSHEQIDLLLVIVKGFIRIRVSTENNIYFTQPMEMEGLANAFNRNTLDSDYVDSKDFKWKYPERVPYIDEQYFDKPLSNLRLFNSNNHKLELDDNVTIDIEIWFSMVLDIMSNFLDWELYSFVWAHFCSQLANIKLFVNSPEQLLLLKEVVCKQLTLNLPNNCTLPEGFTKSHLQVAFVRLFSALIGYHGLFTKYDEDDIIRSLLFGVDSWEKTAIPSVHILTMFCHETPLSIKKYLSTILIKLQTKVTSIFASSHILEFLMALINIENVTSNLNIDDARRIFGIAFKFIQHSSDAIENMNKEGFTQALPRHGIEAAIDQTPSTKNSSENSHVLLQYVRALSYNVISTWFLKLDMTVRKNLSSFILKNLVAVNPHEDVLDDHVLAYVDLIIRFTYNDLPLKIVNPKEALDELKKKEGTVSTSSWITGTTIATISTITETGKSIVVLRRPTGVSIFHLEFDESLFSPETKFLNNPIVNPSHILLQGINSIEESLKPIPLIEDSINIRAIATLDRIPIVEFHKIGIVYISRNQNSEVEVLANRGGSKSYQKFVDSMGHLVKLKNCREVYVGGLDIENGTDGEYAMYWSDKTVQVIYHTTTLMPNHETDLYYDFKKRHIGNNYVNIYFDESGNPFDFNLIKSQFNFINIVISPHTKSFSFHEDASEPFGKTRYFKVKLYRRSGIPGVFATCHFKIVSEDALAYAVRGLAITACQFADVWQANYHGKFITNWGHRVKQIKTLRQRVINAHEALKQEQLLDKDTQSGVNDATQSFLSQLEFGTLPPTVEATNRYVYTSVDDNKLYATLEFNSYT